MQISQRYLRSGLLSLAALGMGTVALARPPVKVVHWAAYQSKYLRVQLTVPNSWVPVKSATALGFHSQGSPENRAAIGVMKSISGMSIEEAATRQMQDGGHPEQWQRASARVAGLPAIKVIGTSLKSPDFKIVQYYVETEHGPYLIQCMAPQASWSAYGSLFADMLNRLKFLP